jgi:hypothetical protein
VSPLMFRPRRVVPPPEPPLDGPLSANRFAYVDSLKPPYGPDPVVFGPGPQAAPSRGYLLLWCGKCDVRWAEAAGQQCWHCEGDG